MVTTAAARAWLTSPHVPAPPLAPVPPADAARERTLDVWLPSSEHRQVKATLFDDLTVFDDVVLLEWVRRYWFPCNITIHVPALRTRILYHNR